MEKQKNSIDNLFREVLKDHEIVPSERAKEAFLKEASEIPERRGYRGGIFLYFILAILFIMGSFAIYYFPAGISNNDPVETKAVQSPKPTENNNSSNDLAQTNQSIPANPNETKTISQANQPVQALATKKVNKEPAKAFETHSNPAVTIPVIEIPANQSTQTKEKAPSGETIIPVTTPPPTSTEPSMLHETADTSGILPSSNSDTINTPQQPVDQKEKKQRISKDWYFSLSAQYTPEWMFNTLEETKFVNNFGMEGIFTIGRYSIRTGLGLSVTKGTNELVVEYNDYMGSFNKLDSISFTWDGSAQDYIPSLYLSNQEVWDSLMKLDYPKVVKRYTYLQIPLIFGYDFLHQGRFSLGVRGGPLLSILINSKQLTDDYDPGKNKVIRINNITPEQVSLNWQFMGGINASVRLSESLNFEIEPMAKYYFNSVYEKSEITKKPWSIGIRAALIIKL